MTPRVLVAGLTPPTVLMACALVVSATPLDRVSADGTWREFDLLRASHALTVYEPDRSELLSIGGLRNECWVFPLTGAGEWQRLPAPTTPISIDDSWSDWDPIARRVYFLAAGPGGALEVRTLQPRTGEVATIPATGSPGAVTGATMVFDTEQQRVIVHGESVIGTPVVWALDLLPTPAWSEWIPDGPSPPTHDYAVLDPSRRLLVQLTGTPEMYTLSLDGPPQWASLLTSDPAPSVMGPVVYETAGDRYWTISKDGQAYALSPATLAWTPIQLPGPSPRVRPGIAIDDAGHRIFVHGGTEFFSGEILGSLSALSIGGTPGWTEIVRETARPRQRVGAGDAFDPVRRRLILFGGVGQQGDAWVLDVGAIPRWSRLLTTGRAPDVQEGSAVAWDEPGQTLLVYGGWSSQGVASADAWALAFFTSTPAWGSFVALGPQPDARAFSQLVYDTRRDRYLLLPGLNGQMLVDDVWEYRPRPESMWRKLRPSGTPPTARFAAMAGYDPVHDRLIMFGGSDLNDVKGDLWALNFGSGDGAWQELAAPSGPAPRCQGLMRLDTARNRLLLFGGYGGRSRVIGGIAGDEQLALNDAWALELDAAPAWRRLSPEGSLPFGRDRANGAYDPINDRLVLTCGGPIGSSYALGSNDVWTLSFSTPATPSLIEVASEDVTVDRVRLTWRGAAPGEHATAYRRDGGAPWRSLGILFADGDGTFTLVDPDVAPEATIQYRLGVPTNQGEVFVGSATVQIPPVAPSLAARAVDGRVSFTIVLPSHEPATLTLFDLAGRRVWSAAAGDLGPGRREVTTTTLRSAFYFARLRQGDVSRFARVAVFQ